MPKEHSGDDRGKKRSPVNSSKSPSRKQVKHAKDEDESGQNSGGECNFVPVPPPCDDTPQRCHDCAKHFTEKAVTVTLPIAPASHDEHDETPVKPPPETAHVTVTPVDKHAKPTDDPDKAHGVAVKLDYDTPAPNEGKKKKVTKNHNTAAFIHETPEEKPHDKKNPKAQGHHGHHKSKVAIEVKFESSDEESDNEKEAAHKRERKVTFENDEDCSDDDDNSIAGSDWDSRQSRLNVNDEDSDQGSGEHGAGRKRGKLGCKRRAAGGKGAPSGDIRKK